MALLIQYPADKNPFRVTLGGEAMAKYMFGRPDSAKTRWQDFSDCLYAAAIEAGIIPK